MAFSGGHQYYKIINNDCANCSNINFADCIKYVTFIVEATVTTNLGYVVITLNKSFIKLKIFNDSEPTEKES